MVLTAHSPQRTYLESALLQKIRCSRNRRYDGASFQKDAGRSLHRLLAYRVRDIMVGGSPCNLSICSLQPLPRSKLCPRKQAPHIDTSNTKRTSWQYPPSLTRKPGNWTTHQQDKSHLQPTAHGVLRGLAINNRLSAHPPSLSYVVSLTEGSDSTFTAKLNIVIRESPLVR
jgi:hypothetical protein